MCQLFPKRSSLLQIGRAGTGKSFVTLVLDIKVFYGFSRLQNALSALLGPCDGQNLVRVFNSRPGRASTSLTTFAIAKQPSLVVKTLKFSTISPFPDCAMTRRYDTRHNDIQRNDAQHNNTKMRYSAECRYVKCRCAESRCADGKR